MSGSRFDELIVEYRRVDSPPREALLNSLRAANNRMRAYKKERDELAARLKELMST